MRSEQPRALLRYERILDAALSVFSRRGYRDTAVDEIAAEAETSKGGVYFHFPNKQAIFLTLLDRMARLLQSRAEAAMEAETDLVRRLDAALLTVLHTFASHRSLARLFLVEAFGAGREFNEKMIDIHHMFSGLIQRELDTAVEKGLIEEIDTRLAGQIWFGGLNEVVMDWVLSENPEPLEGHYPALREFMLNSVGLYGAKPALSLEGKL